jgi:hypothetical protein
MEESQLAVIEQRTVALPFLDEEVPALFMADGRIYIPVYEVCRALGIRADKHIRHWQTLVVWITARKLPLQTEKRGRRLVWCLLISQVPYLYSLFDWQLVSPQRRMQLRRATEEQAKLANLAYQRMQQYYKALRQGLFQFLLTCSSIEKILQRYADVLFPILGDKLSLDLKILLDKGRFLYQQVMALARKMLLDQDESTIIDTFMVDVEGRLIETYSFPLLPIVSDQDSKQFFNYIDMLMQWYQDFNDFLVQYSLT